MGASVGVGGVMFGGATGVVTSATTGSTVGVVEAAGGGPASGGPVVEVVLSAS